MAHLVGQQVGNYRLIHLLGRGGFAEVYLGEHVLVPGIQAAIKILSSQYADAELQSFCNEASTIFLLVHPFIVRVLDFGIEERTPFLVMEYAPHGTMRQRHPEGTQVPLPSILHYIKQVAEALQFAHEHRVIHRDIKPENLLLGRRDDILLSDFGISIKAHRPISQTPQKITGTALYMAPEQCMGNACQASDQYALGVVVYEWLSGAPPFPGNDPISIALHHLHHPPPPLRAKIPRLAPEVEQVVLKALAKDPHERFPSVQAFATALEAASRRSGQQRFPSPGLPASDSASTNPLPLLPAQESSPATPAPASPSPPGAELPTELPAPRDLPPSGMLPSGMLPSDMRFPDTPSSLPPFVDAPLIDPESPATQSTPSWQAAQQKALTRRLPERPILESGSPRYALGGLILALIGILIIAQNGGSSSAMSLIIGGLAIILGCIIGIGALLL